MKIDERKEAGISASGRPGLVTGALVAAMLTASLIAVFYLAWKVAGLPFVPFDVFDWMTRLLLGQVLAAGNPAHPRHLFAKEFDMVRSILLPLQGAKRLTQG